jgi:uncharacterized protein
MNLPAAPSLDRSHPAHDPHEGVNQRGMIVTGARRCRVPREFEPVIARAVERAKAMEVCPALYVYGSVATGTARVGRSDVDLVTVGLDPAQARRLEVQLSAEFAGVCRGVEVGPAQRSDYEGPGDEAYGNRAFLHHYCVHLAGPDVGLHLTDFPADEAAARGFNGDIGLCATRWRVEASREPYPVLLGRRVARKTLLAVAGLVSIHDSIWTTDRVASARRWGLLRPHWATSLQELVQWSSASAPGPSCSEVQISVDGVVAAVVDEFRKNIGLWP